MKQVARTWVGVCAALIAGCAQVPPDGPNPWQPGTCMQAQLAEALGKQHLLVGAQLEDSLAAGATLDARYFYLAGGIFDGPAPCASCTASCQAGGSSCADGDCDWWGCWQDTSQPPGAYLRRFLSHTDADEQIPWVTYYELLHASGTDDGTDEVDAVADAGLMQRYFADFRFVLQQIGTRVALLHLEPDFWGYAQFVSSDPHTLPAAVASANPQDCGSLENSVAGMGRCLIAMVRKYAPNARVGLHASAWSTEVDVMLNDDASFDVAAEARETAAFLVAAGAGQADFVVVEALDRDAGYYETRGSDRWWDATNATLPDFQQALAWVKAVSEGIGRPNIWWQLPVGNLSLPNTNQKYRDNRVDYFFDHPQELVAAHSAGMLFGAGEGQQTTPGTDSGHFLSRAQSHAQAGGVTLCP